MKKEQLLLRTTSTLTAKANPQKRQHTNPSLNFTRIHDGTCCSPAGWPALLSTMCKRFVQKVFVHLLCSADEPARPPAEAELMDYFKNRPPAPFKKPVFEYEMHRVIEQNARVSLLHPSPPSRRVPVGVCVSWLRTVNAPLQCRARAFWMSRLAHCHRCVGSLPHLECTAVSLLLFLCVVAPVLSVDRCAPLSRPLTPCRPLC